MKIHNHLHPGEIIKNIINRMNLSITEMAKMLGVKRLTVSKLLNGHVGISPEMAVRLSIFFGNSIEMWINLQSNFEAWKVEKELKKIAKQVTPFSKRQKPKDKPKAA